MFLLSQVSFLKKRHHQGSLNGTHFGGIKQYKSMAILRDFPYNNALSGLVSYNDPWSLNQQKSPTSRLVLGNFPLRSWWIWPDASWNVPSPGHRDLKKNFVVGRIVDPKNRGIWPPKWMVKIRENPIKMGWFGGKHHYFWVDTHVFMYCGGGNSKNFGIFTPKIGEDEPTHFDFRIFFKGVETPNLVETPNQLIVGRAIFFEKSLVTWWWKLKSP